eukprot:11744673-Ditylum_brightwellii.AAC.1
MKSAKEELQRAKWNLEKEHDFIQNVSAQSPNNIVKFDVRGTPMATRRSTLSIFKESQLGRQFDEVIWTTHHKNTPSVKQWSYEQVTDWAKHHDEISDEVA